MAYQVVEQLDDPHLQRNSHGISPRQLFQQHVPLSLHARGDFGALLLALVLGKRFPCSLLIAQQPVQLAQEEIHPVVVRGGLSQLSDASGGASR